MSIEILARVVVVEGDRSKQSAVDREVTARGYNLPHALRVAVRQLGLDGAFGTPRRRGRDVGCYQWGPYTLSIVMKASGAVRVPLSLSPDVLERLDAMAEATGETRSGMVARLVRGAS